MNQRRPQAYARSSRHQRAAGVGAGPGDVSGVSIEDEVRVTRNREEKLFTLAMVASVIFHGLLVYALMNFPLGLAMDSSLFDESEVVEMTAVEVHRATEDLIEVDTGGADPDATAGDLTATAGLIGKDSQKKLETIEPDKLSLPAPPRAPREQMAKPDVATSTPVAPKSRRSEPAAAHMVDLTRKLLSVASPDVALPKYVGPTDRVVAPDPSDNAIDPSVRISQQQLNRLLARLDGPGGTGLAVGVLPGATGSVASLFDDGAVNLRRTPPRPAPPPRFTRPAKPRPTVRPRTSPTEVMPEPALIVPPIELPDLPRAVTKPGGDKPTEKPAVHLDEDFEYSLHISRELPRGGGLFGGSKKPKPGEPAWFEVRVRPKRTLRRLEHLHKDVVFVIDTSSSITDAWVNRVKSGVGLALESLNPGDRFNIVMFKDTIDVLSTDGLLDAAPGSVDRAKRFLNAAQSSGYTDVNRALGRLIVRSMPRDRVYQIVMISDGKPTRGTIDARSIINFITRENDLVAGIYCVAVGDAIDRQLLEYLAYRNKGYVVRPESLGRTEGVIQALAAELRYPLVKDASFDAVGVDTSTIYPRIPRDIYQGQTVHLYGRYRPSDDDMSMRLQGIAGDNTLDLTFTLDFSTAELLDGDLSKRWAFWKLHHLYSEMIREGESRALQDQIDALRKRYRIDKDN